MHKNITALLLSTFVVGATASTPALADIGSMVSKANDAKDMATKSPEEIAKDRAQDKISDAKQQASDRVSDFKKDATHNADGDSNEATSSGDEDSGDHDRLSNLKQKAEDKYNSTKDKLSGLGDK
ncbi:hypothetical protein [Carnimonas bestiolae]|uniref:hypothetical protein n=1 Tax=Carnimonas bestiolae TaxID=3402172 RepID=UPI003EDBC6CB